MLCTLLTADDCSYGQQVAAASVLAVCSSVKKNKRVMMQLSVIEAAFRLIGCGEELTVEVTCCVCSMMTDDGWVHCISFVE